jgi:hypothetical protein
MLKKYIKRVWSILTVSGLGQGPAAGFREHGRLMDISVSQNTVIS